MKSQTRSLPVLALLASMSIPAPAGTVCHIVLSGCPEGLSGKTITLPPEAVAISRDIRYCKPLMDLKASGPVSLVLLLDESSSMNDNDSSGARYQVARQMLNIIYTMEPSTRVGIVPFTNRLSWDIRDNNPLFRRISQSQYSDAYMAPVRLDSVFADGKRGLEKLQEVLTTSGNRLANSTSQPDERTNGSVGTDVSLAFEAAKDALRDSPFATARRYIVFFSDGLPQNVDDERKALQNQFLSGNGVPTTYTFYLCPRCQAVPSELIQMTQNIRVNGYSNSNPRSSAWSVGKPESELLKIIQDSILTGLFAAATAARSAAFLGQQSATRNDSAFTFPRIFPLSPDLTQGTLAVTYGYSYQDNPTQGSAKDTVLSSALSFERKEGASWSTLPAGVGKICFDRDLSLYSEGVFVAPAATMGKEQRELDLILTLEGVAPSEGPSVTVSNAEGTDRITLPLDFVDGKYRARFSRAVGGSQNTRDRILQHLADDSIIVVWRNPNAPLDTLRMAYSFHTTVYPPFAFEIKAVPNPFVPDMANGLDIAGLPREGAVLVLRPTVPNDSIVTKIERMSAVIYDAVGNVVRGGLEGRPFGNLMRFYLPWDGRNSRERTVGSGSYLAMVSVRLTGEDGRRSDEVRGVMIGVK